MKRFGNLVPLLIGLALVSLVSLVLFWFLSGRAQATPEAFDLRFSATGLVEDISFERGGRCTVQIAVYDWLTLSQGFPLEAIPQQDDRYRLRAEGATCQAVEVAMATTDNHIGFETGRAGNSWYFTQLPVAALGCGGLELDWTPAPL